MVGAARCSTVMSIASTTVGRASTASPIHSRRPARCGALSPVVTGVSFARTREGEGW